MKKLLLFIGIALCLASCSVTPSAKEDKNTEDKNITLIVGGDTIDCSQAILDKYGSEKIIQAHKKGKIICDTIVVIKNVIPIQKRTTTYLYLIKEGNKVVEFVSSPIEASEVNWRGVICIPIIFIIVILAFCMSLLRRPSRG